MKFYKKNKKGFTLIDILLTAAIISLLSSVFLFRVSEAKKKANDSHMKVEAQQVSTAMALYKNDNNGRVPLTVTTAAGTRYAESSDGYRENMQALVDAGYLPEIPTSPYGNAYSYLVAEDGMSALFAVALSEEASGDVNKNSCDIETEEIEFGTCRSVGFSLGWVPDPDNPEEGSLQATNKNCSDHQYDEDEEICFDDIESSFVENCSCSNSSQSSINPSYPDIICSQIYSSTVSSMGASNWQNLLNQNGGDLSCSDILPYANAYTRRLYMCEYEGGGICDGSSNLDYCECI